MKRSLLLFSLLIMTPLAWGQWVGVGGGELFKDAHNPFFLKNVSKVEYCLDIASTSVSASPDTIRRLVGESLDYWKAELRKASDGPAAGQFKLGTQTFEEVACTKSSTQLRFQFGYETLSPEQIEYLKTPENFIGVSVRTEYDAELRAKGFIYIASDRGPHSYHKGADPTLVKEAWQRPQLLKYVLLHELGHIFGVPHVGSGLMAETFLEQVLSVALADAFERMPIESFFSPDDELDLCGYGAVSNVSRLWFSLPSDHGCIHLSRGKNNSFQWEAFSRKDQRAPRPGTRIGKFIAANPTLEDYHPKPAIVLQLMGNTTIFTPEEMLFRTFMFGPHLLDIGLKGNFVPIAGPARPVFIRQTPRTLTIQGVHEGKIESLFSYFSPLDILVMRDPTPLRPTQKGDRP